MLGLKEVFAQLPPIFDHSGTDDTTSANIRLVVLGIIVGAFIG